MTERVDLDNLDLGSRDYSDQEIEELFEGAENLIPDQDKESPVVESFDPQNDPAFGLEAGDEQVILINVKFPQQSFGLHNQDGTYTGKQAQFQDGLLITDRDTANKIKAMSPHVHEEPREGHVFGPFRPTGFRTRNADAYDEHMSSYYRNL
jgi:hypothetical protein